MTALMFAAIKSHIEAMKALLDRGANVDREDEVSGLGEPFVKSDDQSDGQSCCMKLLVMLVCFIVC
jgi:ankyrin repeat protein